MDANAVSLLAIFERKMRLEIPLFQRQYVWSQEQQWEPLWEDISRKFTESIEGRQDAPVHFLGAMVLDQKQTPVTHVEKRQVIDGQQRLTTFQLFLAAFRDFCRENECIELAMECEGFTENKGMLADPAVDRFKVWPTLVDREQFANVLLSGSRAELERRHPIVWRKYARKPEPRPRMVQAYLFFHDQLREFFIGSAEEPPIGTDFPLSTRLLECFQALKNLLRVVTIDLQQGDDAQVIFETLNARGEPLLPADLLRNYIFLRAARAGHDQENLYHTYWQPFDDEFWRVEVKQGRLIRPRSDLFMQHFLASQLEEDIPVKHLFVEYRNWIERRRPFQNVEEELQTLARHGRNFRRILEPTPGDTVYHLAVFLEAFDIRTAYPLLLLMMDSDISPMEWGAITEVLESYLLRRSVCGYNTKNYNRVFLQLTKNLRRNGVTSASLIQQLAQQTGESAVWPSDAAFRDAWMRHPAYDLGNAKLVHILGRINLSFANGWNEPLVFQQQPSIEHLMPQKWIDNWPLGDGSQGMEFLEALQAPDGDTRAAATERRNRMVQTFGNLTILMQGLNSSQSNLGWLEKRPVMMANSLLPINQGLNAVQEWDEDAIETRGADLYVRAARIWSDPATFAARLRGAQAAE